jgi:uncharacterized protein
VLLSGSAIGVYGNRGDEVLDERAASAPISRRRGTRVGGGHGPAEQAGIRVVHLRTGIVQGAAGGALAKQAPLFKLGVGGPLGDGNQWISPIALDDHIGATHFCLMRDDISGPVNLVAPESVTNTRYSRVLASVLSRPALVPAPAFALRLALGREMADATVLASQRVAPGVLQAKGFRFRFPTIESTLRFELGQFDK